MTKVLLPLFVCQNIAMGVLGFSFRNRSPYHSLDKEIDNPRFLFIGKSRECLSKMFYFIVFHPFPFYSTESNYSQTYPNWFFDNSSTRFFNSFSSRYIWGRFFITAMPLK